MVQPSSHVHCTSPSGTFVSSCRCLVYEYLQRRASKPYYYMAHMMGFFFFCWSVICSIARCRVIHGFCDLRMEMTMARYRVAIITTPQRRITTPIISMAKFPICRKVEQLSRYAAKNRVHIPVQIACHASGSSRSSRERERESVCLYAHMARVGRALLGTHRIVAVS